MNIYALPYFISAILVFLLSIFVFSRNKTSAVNRTFSLFGFCVFIWLLCYSIGYQFKEANLAVFWLKIGYIGVIFIVITAYHLAVAFLNLVEKEKKLIIFIYLIGISFVALLWCSDFFVKGNYKYFWGYYPKASFLHPLYLVFLVILVMRLLFLLGVSMLRNNRTKSINPQQYQRLKYVFIGLSVFAFAATDFIQNYGVQIYPLGFIFVLFYLCIMSYAIVRHQLMDIEVIVKKSLVFGGMFAFVFGVVVAMAMLVAHFLGGANNLLALAISALIITFTLRPIETWLINVTDRFLFQKKHQYKEILKTFIDEIVTVLDLNNVINSTLDLLAETIHPYASIVFIHSKAEDKYLLYGARGIENKNITFTSDSKLIAYLKSGRFPAIIKQINGIVGANPEVQKEMAQLKAVVCLPFIIHNDLIGFIALGPKKSDEDYTKDDLDILLDLARTESIAVANAQLLTEAAQAERRAAIGTMAAGINHEIGNPLNIINTKIQLFLASAQRGLFKDKSKDDILEECTNILNETIKQSNRIADITKRLSNFAKPGKEFRPEAVRISEEIDEALGVVGHDLNVDRIKVEKHIPDELPAIWADRREIQQIFFNLIRNAAQAIEDTGTISISAHINENKKIRIEIRDTGRGISEDKKHRIFEPFFTTKSPTKGTGLGLSIVRQLVWRNKGEISFQSKAGEGTIFILEFSMEG